MLLNILAGLIYVPILLHFLGKSQYGLYQLMGSVIAYMAVMDFGLSNTITRYYSRYLALDDKRNQSNILAISSIIYGFITIIVLVIGAVLYINIDVLFSNSLTISELNKAKEMFIIMIVNIAITIPSHIFTAVIDSHERFIFVRLLSIVQTVLLPFLLIAVMSYKADVIGVVLVQVALNLATIVAKIYYSFRKINIKIKFYSWDKNLAREMIIFAFFVFLNMIIDQIYWKTDQIILGIVSGTSVVAVYSIASQLITYYINFSANINNVFLPKVSAISAKTDDMTEINTLFNKVGRIQFAIMSLILTGFILYGKSFITFWAGKDFTEAYYISLVVMIPLLVPLIENMGIIILQAKNKHAFRSVVYFIIAILNIIISIPLAKSYGGFGCAIGTSASLIIGNIVIINIYYHKKVGIDIIAFIKDLLSMVIPIFISLCLGLIANHFIDTTSIVVLGFKMVLYIIIYSLLMWLVGFNDYEKGLFKEILFKLNALIARG